MNRLSRYLPEEAYLVIILVVAALLRFWGYGSFSYANDELSAIIRTQYPTFKELVSQGFYVDGHPGGIQVLLFYWIKLGGTSAAWVRLPFVLMGIGSVAAIYYLGKLWFHKSSGLFAAACLAFLEYPLLFSRIARPYGPGLLFTLLMVIAWTKLVYPANPLNVREERKKAVWLGLASVACMYTHYFSFLGVIVVGLTGLLVIPRHRLLHYILAYGIAIVLFIPHIYITINHLTYKGVGEWLGKPDINTLPRYMYQAFNHSWLLLCLIGIINSYDRSRWKASATAGISYRYQIIGLSWFTVVYGVAYLYSVAVNPVLQDSVLLFVFPFLLLFFFSFLRDNFTTPMKILLLALVLFGTLDTIASRKFYARNHFGDFKGVAEKISTWQLRCGADKVTSTLVANNPWYVNFYLKDLSGEMSFAQSDNRGGKDIKDLIDILRKSKTPYFIHAWTKPEPAELQDIILGYYPYIIEDHNFNGLSSATLYGKKCFTGICKEVTPIHTEFNDFEGNDLWGYDKNLVVRGSRTAGNESLVMDSTHEFGPTFSLKISELDLEIPFRVKVDVLGMLPDSLSDASIVVSLQDEKGETYVWSGQDFSLYLESGQWGNVYLSLDIPELRSIEDKIGIYIWKPKKGKVYLDNFRIRFFEGFQRN